MSNEWTTEENAYCFIELLKWKSLSTEKDKDDLIKKMLNNKIFSIRNEAVDPIDTVRQHLDYLYSLVTGNIGSSRRIPDKDKCLLKIYP